MSSAHNSKCRAAVPPRGIFTKTIELKFVKRLHGIQILSNFAA